MGKSLRSKRMRANRNRKRIVNRPKELTKLKAALAFEYNEQNENAHVSMFNDIVNGPLPNDGTYFEPSVTVLEKSQIRYENFLSRKIPKIAEIASKNLVRPMEEPEQSDGESDDNQEARKRFTESAEDRETEHVGCKPNKLGSWPKWMNHRTIRQASRKRRKYIKRIVNRERRINKVKKGAKKIFSQKEDKSSNSSVDAEMNDS